MLMTLRQVKNQLKNLLQINVSSQLFLQLLPQQSPHPWSLAPFLWIQQPLLQFLPRRLDPRMSIGNPPLQTLYLESVHLLHLQGLFRNNVKTPFSRQIPHFLLL
ncbi:hypothetical protein EMPG_17513 [Blastomyces silverae]|uniref:Uncharacterized protein n=1 Tax=Blastomyces silverae TaxID=2060906 RepID=A0A0H1B7D2_9EURO|nr:hypothetical protein EMPG_17513 [Blastomyces silverae]